jgi:hypothetical protein
MVEKYSHKMERADGKFTPNSVVFDRMFKVVLFFDDLKWDSSSILFFQHPVIQNRQFVLTN